MYQEARFEGPWKIGDTMTYPLSTGVWSLICEIPEQAARSWINVRVPLDVSLGFGELGESKAYEWPWLNKLAVVVDFERCERNFPLALCAHDEAYYLIHKV